MHDVERMYSLAVELREQGDSTAATFLVGLEGEDRGLTGVFANGGGSVVCLFVSVVNFGDLHRDRVVVSPLFMDHSVEGRAQRVGRQRVDDGHGDGAGPAGLARLQGGFVEVSGRRPILHL